MTELAGRGIGMDVVRAEVNALGGRIETATAAGQGTSFKLVLPLTTAVTQVVMMRSGELLGRRARQRWWRSCAAPPAKEVRAGLQRAASTSSAASSCRSSGPARCCRRRRAAPSRRRKTLPVVVFRSAAQRIAVHVDEVLGNQEVVVKNLGPQLARLPGLAGMTVLASGAVVLIYNPVALAHAVRRAGARSSAPTAPQPEARRSGAEPARRRAAAAPQIPLVLVVDDSITVRRVTQRLLQREGYRVALAKPTACRRSSGWPRRRPTVVLSDIEMPRMDGFDLARNIRADARWRDLPIIMITSRIAEKHREHAKRTRRRPLPGQAVLGRRAAQPGQALQQRDGAQR